MRSDDLTDLWIGAFRYYCGRCTITVNSFCDSLIRELDNIPIHAKNIIKRDLKEALAEDNRHRAEGSSYRRLGHDCDRVKWLEVLGALDGKPDSNGVKKHSILRMRS